MRKKKWRKKIYQFYQYHLHFQQHCLIDFAVIFKYKKLSPPLWITLQQSYWPHFLFLFRFNTTHVNCPLFYISRIVHSDYKLLSSKYYLALSYITIYVDLSTDCISFFIFIFIFNYFSGLIIQSMRLAKWFVISIWLFVMRKLPFYL